MKYKIGIWGQFGDGGKIADGQAVRTTIITKELQIRYGNESVGVVNTNGWKSHPIKFLLESFRLVKDSGIIIIAPADNGYKVFVPLLILFNLLYRRILVHIVIGGFLPELLRQNTIYRWLENRFSAIFVQTENLRKDLHVLGIKNLHILSNLKRLNSLSLEDLKLYDAENISVCTFSRINKEKGIEDAVEAVEIVNKKLGGEYVHLDIFGLIQPGYEVTLNKILEEHSKTVSYRGIVDYNKTVEVLSQYFVLLFPTYYYGEGFPGNVADAYNSGLPIIATDWLYNRDVICDGRNGLFVPIQSSEALASAILELYNDREKHLNMSRNCLIDSKKYHPDIVLNDLYLLLDANLV